MEIASSSLLRDFMKTVFTILEGGEIFVIKYKNEITLKKNCWELGNFSSVSYV